jgi:cytochrome oxidase assembly protein ShyY1
VPIVPDQTTSTVRQTSSGTSHRPGRQRVVVSRGRWLAYATLVVVFAVVCVLLSQWQFARREEVRRQIELIDTNFDATPQPLSKVLSPGEPLPSSAEWLPVVATGHYLPSLQTLVRNRSRDSATGFDIIVPFMTSEGAVFVVDRGWLPSGKDGLAPVSTPTAPAGTVEVTARLRKTEPVLQGQSDTVTTISSIHVAELAAKWNLKAYTGAYGLLASEKPAAPTGELASKPQLTEGNHLSYALQWIAFAVLGFVALVWAIRNERRVAERSAQAGANSGHPSPPSRSGRRDRDAEIEDALLDEAES